jgi:hypothetical protein
MAFGAAVVLLLISSKGLPFNISFISGNGKSDWGLDPVNRKVFPAQLFVYWLKTPSQTMSC